MIQSIYTSVSNADIVPCGKKGLKVSSEPIPLLRNNYLGEYRTELEKAKVRKNLGIADELSLRWENIEGHLENATELVDYIKTMLEYTTDLNSSVTNVKQALDYVLYFVTNFKGEEQAVNLLLTDVKQINIDIDTLENTIRQNKLELQGYINNNITNIDTLDIQVKSINDQIKSINDTLKVIDVDNLIATWIENKIKESKTINISNELLEVKISSEEDNAIELNKGLYVKDYSEDVAKIAGIELSIICSKEEPTTVTIGGITEGTVLKDKTIQEVLDLMLFPTLVRPLKYPSLYYSSVPSLVKVGDAILEPTINYVKNDAGEATIIEEVLNSQNVQVTGTYDSIGTYIHKATANYSAGDYLINNKGETTDIRIEAGTLETEVKVTATYPWYTSEKDTSKIQLPLVAFGLSPELEFSLTGQAQIWLPGSNSTIISFMADAGLGFLNVDMNGWEPSESIENGITYKVWTKSDSYSVVLPHKIKFKLAL